MQARLLCIALVHAFFPPSHEARAEVAELERDPARWALDEKLVLLGGEILGAAAAASAGTPGPGQLLGGEDWAPHGNEAA